MPRDYVADMNAWMVQAVKRLPPNAGIVARQIVARPAVAGTAA